MGYDVLTSGGGAGGGAGATGASFLSGAGAPASGLGANGDSYLNTTNGDVYGPKAAGAWGSPTGNIKGATGAAGPTLSMRQAPAWFTDCLGVVNSVLSPYVLTAISSGTVAQVNPPAGHPGVIRLTSSTTANSGERLQTDVLSLLMATGDVCEVGFSLPTTNAGTTIRLGFLDATGSTDAADGVYAEIVNATLSFKTASNSTRVAASNTATLTAGTWYRARVEMVATADCRVTLFDDAGNVVLAEQAITSGLPTGAGRYTGVGVVATNSGTTATDLVDIDYISYARATASALTR